jgi:hypothetical protein
LEGIIAEKNNFDQVAHKNILPPKGARYFQKFERVQEGGVGGREAQGF